MKERLLGLALIAGGCFLFYSCCYQPYQDALAHKDSIRYSVKGTLCVPALTGFGIVHLFLGKFTPAVLGSRTAPTKVSYILGVVLVLAGAFLFYGIQSFLSSHGYGR